MTNTNTSAVDLIDSRFKSGNSVPVERTHITADEWAQIRALIPQWRDIADAPKDGTQILTFCDGDFSVRYWGEGEDEEMAWLPRIRGVFPTHFQNLIPPVSRQQDGET